MVWVLAASLFQLLAQDALAFYNAKTGCWPSRDPMDEPGFELLQNGSAYGDPANPNLCTFVANNPISAIDFLGLKLGDVPGEIPFPPYNPPDLGKPCCCNDPTSIDAKRTDSHPTGFFAGTIWSEYWLLHLSVLPTIKGTCYKELVIQWWTCWRGGVFGIGETAGYAGSGSSVDVPVQTYTGFGSNWQTGANIHFLTCDGGKWKKNEIDRPLGYFWSGWNWSH
jgi:hypothetical protein